MKLYESCFDYKLSVTDIEYLGESWEIELDKFKNSYDPELDFMEQLSKHNLFLLVCMLDLSNDDYMEKCYEIQSIVLS